MKFWYLAVGLYEACRLVPENYRIRRTEREDTRDLDGDKLIDEIARKWR